MSSACNGPRAHIRQRFGDELAGQPFAALVNVALPDESRILKAPLAIAAGGWGQLEQGGWKNSDDPDCQKLRGLVQAAIQPLPPTTLTAPAAGPKTAGVQAAGCAR